MEFPAPPHMRRNTSYRKPVPIYIPSPPPSPNAPIYIPSPPPSPNAHPTPTFTPQRGSVPPLPADWKVMLRRAMDIDAETTPPPDATIREEANETHCLDDHRTCVEGPQSPRSPRRGLPQVFRPPTPPLPAQTRKREFLDQDVLARPLIPVAQPGIPEQRPTDTTLPEHFPAKLEPLRYTPANAGRAIHTHPHPPLSTRPSLSTVSSLTLVPPGCGTVRSVQHEPDDATSEHWHNLPVLSMHIVKLAGGKVETSKHSMNALPELTWRGRIDGLSSLVRRCLLAFTGTLKHALCGCFAGSN